MKKSTTNKNFYYTIGVIILILIWEAISLLFDESNMIFPSFFEVFKKTVEILSTSYIYKNLFFTLIRMFIGFSISIIFALILGSISSISEKIKYIIVPFITVLKTIPTASLVFFFLILSGARYAPIYIVILICLPILYESIQRGYDNIDPNINDELALINSSKISKIIYVRFPLIKPYLMIGIASSLGLSFKIEVMAEVLTGLTSNGLGSIIAYVQKVNPIDMIDIFAYSLVAILLSLLIDLICENYQDYNNY